MSDKKISQLTSMNSTSSEDLMLVIDSPNGTPASKKITVKAFFSAIPANTVFVARSTHQANVIFTGGRNTVTGNLHMNTLGTATVNNFVTVLRSNPGSNNATSGGFSTGQMWFSNTHLYIAVNATSIKRVALSTF